MEGGTTAGTNQSQPGEGGTTAGTNQSQPGQDNTNTTGYYGEGEFGPRLDYTESHWRDPVWAILWIVHMLVMIYALAAIWGTSDIDTTQASDAFLVIFIVAVIGAVCGIAWIQILRKCAGTIIKIMLILNLVLFFIGMLVFFAIGNIFGAVIMIVFGIIFGLYARAVWPRIPFAAVLIDIAGSIMQTYQGTIWVSILCLVLQIIWVLWWAAVASGYFSYDNPSGFVMFAMFVSFYWSLQVFQNISHMTTCGVAGAWYFSSGHNGGLTVASLKRTLTTSFGSVCLGSLIVAIIQAMRAMVRSARSSGSGGIAGAILLCIAACLLRILDRLVQWFNKYAYVQCALYGASFKEGAKRTWDMLRSRGIDAWVNDDLTGFALFCGSVVGGLICGGAAYFMSTYTKELDEYPIPVLMAVIGFVIGYFLVHTVLYTIESGVATLFVCYAEDPDAMNQNRNEEYTALMNVAPEMTPVDQRGIA